MKNLSKVLTIAVIVFTMPVTTSRAAVPDLPLVYNGSAAIATGDASQSKLSADLGWRPLSPVDYNPTAFAARFIELLPAIDAAVKDGLGISTTLIDESIIEVGGQETLVIEQSAEKEGFWTQRKVWTLAGIFLLTFVAILFIGLASGGGSGGSGGGGNGGGGDGNPIIPFGGGPLGDPNDPNGGLTGPNGIPLGGIPHNPEPATFLLAGLGLLIPRLRKRSS